MDLRDFLKMIRTRWVIVSVTATLTVLAAVAFTLTQIPRYQASTRLFVSTAAGTSVSDLYSGNRLAQDRVVSYAQLIMGETLAQRTIDRLNLNIDASKLATNVTAKVKANTVLIDVTVDDSSPVQARDIANALSDEFVIMVRELETPAQGSRPDARVVVEQRATVPSIPVSPKKTRNLAAGVLLGGMLGIGLALLRNVLDNSVKDRETLERTTGLGVAGIIPFDKERRTHPAIPFETDNSPTAEAFRKLRTNLQFLSVDNPPRLIVVTSSTPNEGKSTVAINIALSLAEAENNVLLVDGDMRRPSLARYLDLVGSVGLSTLLSGGASLDDVLQKSKFAQLTVIAAGTAPPNPSELLGSMTAKKLLSELRERFDFVIIDSPPLLAVTDGAILSAETDGALVLVRCGTTKRPQLSQALGVLHDVGANVLGSVLNMAPTRGGSAYYYHYDYGRAKDPQTATGDSASPTRTSLTEADSTSISSVEPDSSAVSASESDR
jgi:capsular exopolysaccharide synthesis family protein